MPPIRTQTVYVPAAEAGDVEVVEVLAVHLAVELTRVLGLDALRLIHRTGGSRIVLRPTQLCGWQYAGLRIRAVDSGRSRRLGRLRDPRVVVDRNVGNIGPLVACEARVEGQLRPND